MELSNQIDALVSRKAFDRKSLELALEVSEAPVGLPLLAARLGDPRLVSFVLAKQSVSLPKSGQLVALWALERAEKSTDQSVRLNLLSWIGRELAAESSLMRPVARRASDLFVRCAGAPEAPLRLALLDLLASNGRAIEVLSEVAAAEVVERLADLRDDPDELTREDVDELTLAIPRTALAKGYRTSPAEVADGLLAIRTQLPRKLHSRDRTAFESWADVVLSGEEAAHRARTANKAVVEFTVAGPSVDLGRLGQLLHAASNLFHEIGGELFGASLESPMLRPIGARIGSFSVQAMVEGKQGRETIDRLEDVMERVAGTAPEGENSDESLAAALHTPQIAKRLRSFLDSVSAQGGQVTTSFLGTRAGQSARGHVLSTERVEHVRKWLESGPEEQPSETTFLATLVAADLSAGTFKCRRSGAEVTGRVPDDTVLDKVRIGKVYQFHVREISEERPIGPVHVFELLGLEVPDAEEFQAVTETVSGAVPGVCVPQASLDRVRQAVNLVAEGEAPTPSAFDVRRQRNVDYYLAAARVLGLLDREAELTMVGRLWIKMGPEEQERQLAVQLELSRVGQAWVAWADVDRLFEVEPGTAEKFLRERTTLGPSTAQTRASSLRAWLTALLPEMEGWGPEEE